MAELPLGVTTDRAVSSTCPIHPVAAMLIPGASSLQPLLSPGADRKGGSFSIPRWLKLIFTKGTGA